MITVNSREDFLIELSKLLPNNCVGVELGVYEGDFSKMILNIINPKELVLIDPYETGNETYVSGLPTAYSTDTDYKNLLKRFDSEISSGRIDVIKDFSYNAVLEFRNKYFDLIYIDASHILEDIRKDLKDWLPKLKNDGCMAGHDYINDEGFGVIEAVNEFCEEHGFEMVLFNSNGGDWALNRKNN